MFKGLMIELRTQRWSKIKCATQLSNAIHKSNTLMYIMHKMNVLFKSVFKVSKSTTTDPG